MNLRRSARPRNGQSQEADLEIASGIDGDADRVVARSEEIVVLYRNHGLCRRYGIGAQRRPGTNTKRHGKDAKQNQC